MVAVANDLLNDKLDVYLPQKEVVLLQWLFDYFNEKRSISAKINVSFWLLLATAWKRLKQDQDTLSRIYLSHNFIATLIDTFTEATLKLTNENEQIQLLVDAVGSAIEAIGESNLWFKMRADTTISLILSYTKFVIHSNRNSPNPVSFSNLSVLISKILKSTLSNSSDLKKLSTTFNTSVLSYIYILLGLDLENSTKDLFNSLISKLIVSTEDQSTDLDLSSILKAADEYKLTDPEKCKSSISLYSILVNSWPKKSASAFSQLRVISPTALKDLVSISSSNKIRLDSEFLESTMTQIFGSKNSNPIDWELLTFIHHIDESFLTEDKRLASVLSASNTKSNDSNFHYFARTLIDYFTNSRELPQFILFWKKHLNNSCWYDDSISEYLSIQVQRLSNIQLKSLLNTLTQPLKQDHVQETPAQLYLPITVCVLSFFQQRTLPNSTLFDPLFLVLKSKIHLHSSEFWTLKYLILSISSGFVDKFQEDVLSQAKEIKYGLSEKNEDLVLNIMQTVFRISEFVQFDGLEKYTSKLISYIGKESSKPEKFLDVICDRWLILVNSRFKEKHIKKIIGLFAMNKDTFSKLCTTDLFFEQHSLSPKVLEELNSSKELKKEILRLQIIATMPLQVIKGEARRELSNTLVELALGKGSDSLEYQLAIRAAISHLLSHPSIAVNVVSDYAIFQKYFRSSGSFKSHQLNDYTYSVCKNILKYHVYNIEKKQEQEGVSTEFISQLVKEEGSTLKNKKKDEYLVELDLATMIVSLVPSDLLKSSNGLEVQIVEELTSILQATKGKSKSLNKALHAIQNLAILATAKATELPQLGDIFKITGSYATLSISQLKDEKEDKDDQKLVVKDLAKSCFTVLTHLSTTKEDVESCMAYYIILLEQGVDLANEDIAFSFKTLSEDDFVKLFQETVSNIFASSSMNKSNSNNNNENNDKIPQNYPTNEKEDNTAAVQPFAYIKAADAFLKAVKDNENDSVSSGVVTLLVQILQHLHELSENDLMAYLELVEFLVKDRTKILTQFCLELIISTIIRLCTTQFGPGFMCTSAETIYVKLAGVASSVVVFNRSRLAGRYHILIQLLTALLGCLTNTEKFNNNNNSNTKNKNKNKISNLNNDNDSVEIGEISTFQPKWISEAKERVGEKSGEAYTRLVTNLSSTVISYRESTDKFRLSSYAQMVKKNMGMHLGVVLINYVRFSLHEGFTPSVRRGLVPGFYVVFNTIGSEQLKHVNLLLDSSSRPYFKTLYDDYMAHGRWRSE